MYFNTKKNQRQNAKSNKYNTNNSKIMNKSNNNYGSRTVVGIEISFRVLITVIKVIKNKE